MKAFAVIFAYSFDDEVAVYLFGTEKEAKKFLKSSYLEEVRIDIEENEWTNITYKISKNGRYAKITNKFQDEDDEFTEFYLGEIYG